MRLIMTSFIISKCVLPVPVNELPGIDVTIPTPVMPPWVPVPVPPVPVPVMVPVFPVTIIVPFGPKNRKYTSASSYLCVLYPLKIFS